MFIFCSNFIDISSYFVIVSPILFSPSFLMELPFPYIQWLLDFSSPCQNSFAVFYCAGFSPYTSDIQLYKNAYTEWCFLWLAYMQSCISCTALSSSNSLVSRSNLRLHLPLKILCELQVYFKDTHFDSHILCCHLCCPNGTIWNHFILCMAAISDLSSQQQILCKTDFLCLSHAFMSPCSPVSFKSFFSFCTSGFFLTL